MAENGLTVHAQRAAQENFSSLVQATIDNLVAARNVDNVGEGDLWIDERLPQCEDDYVYDLAVEVRKARELGTAWWRVAYDLELPGSGATSQQGKAGAAFARRLWRGAWGRTYVGTSAARETRDDRVVRALHDQAKPYFREDTPEMEIIKKIRGAKIEWVVRLGPFDSGFVTSAQETYVHGDERLIWVKVGPKGRYVEFFEQPDSSMLDIDPRQAIAKSGPIRSVYLDRITRVGA